MSLSLSTLDTSSFKIGQRYSVIVEADPSAPVQADGNYWIRTILSQGCGSIDQPKPEIGVIRYDSKSTGLPHSTEHQDLDISCSDVPLSLMEPIVPWAVDHQASVDFLLYLSLLSIGPL